MVVTKWGEKATQSLENFHDIGSALRVCAVRMKKRIECAKSVSG